MQRIELKERAKENLLSDLKIPLISVIITLGIPLIVWGSLQYYFLYFVHAGIPLSMNFILTLPIAVILCYLFVTVLKVGEAKIFVHLSNHKLLRLKTLFQYFRYTIRVCLIHLTKGVLVLAGLLLFIIPGIYLMLAYSLTDFIVAEDKDVDLVEALKMSRGMLKGHTGELLILYLSFLPWLIFGILTGVGLFWYRAYYRATMAEVYKAVRENYTPPEVVLNRRTLY